MADAERPTWLSTAQAAAKLGVTPARMRELLRQNAIPCFYSPLGRLVTLADVEALVARRAAARPRQGEP